MPIKQENVNLLNFWIWSLVILKEILILNPNPLMSFWNYQKLKYSGKLSAIASENLSGAITSQGIRIHIFTFLNIQLSSTKTKIIKWFEYRSFWVQDEAMKYLLSLKCI